MKEAVIGSVILVLVIASGTVWYLNRPPQIPPLNEPNPPNQVEEKQEVGNILTIDSNLSIGSDSSAPVESSPYQEYSKATFDVEAGKKTRILFFYADWCPTCRPVDAEIKANLSKIPKDISIIKVNYKDDFTDADEKELAAKYGVTYQHTFVRIDSAGNEVDKWNGGGFEKLLEYVKALSPDTSKQLKELN